MASLLRSSLSFAAFDASSAEASSQFFWKPLEPPKIGNSSLNLVRTSNARLRIRGSVEEKHTPARKASKEPFRLTRKLTENERQVFEEEGQVLDPFQELEYRFKRFKRKNYVENMVDYQNLAERQSPKFHQQFMVIACADSRVCPSNILGFQPGESFTVRNVANLVPPFQHGASETSAALEFAVNSLEARKFHKSDMPNLILQGTHRLHVENILIVGHSRCGGIQALMSMKDNADSRSFIKDWVSIGKSARLSTKAAAGNLSFEMQCRHCEKESINGSLLNLLTYPWIEKRVSEGTLSLHGGYYDFIDCTFEKWTLVYREGLEGGSKYAIKNRALWS
ncbi:carbonic anhydrase [Musa troglodytarum]|uniref:Carbonic anhydrase n=1 Tax=Musa troglodytarum TaxID=320322 RepID=A0A9E7HEV6_9LILI|nr:carbonic anhydrase [Musa troglodytarum]